MNLRWGHPQLLLEFHRWSVAERRVEASLVVHALQEVLDRSPRLRQIAVLLPMVEWRGALQPRALPEPDVNLSIHPARAIA